MELRHGVNCKGEPVSWEPDWQDIECDECGHVSGRRDAAESRNTQHRMAWREGGLFCEACGAEGTEMDKLTEVTLAYARRAAIESFERSSKLFEYLKGAR